jgi:hypothetical protein
VNIPEVRVVERVDTDKTKHHLFVQGAIEIEIFPEDLIRSIDQIDKLPSGRWTEFAVQNNLPCEPLDRKLLKPPLMGIIQLAWHRQFKGVVSERLVANQERRLETYRQDLEHLKLLAASPAQRVARALKPKPEGKTSTAPKTFGYLYRLTTAAAEKWSQYTSQKGLIVAVMVAAGAAGDTGKGITKDAVIAALRGKLNTKQPEERVVGFYMSEWKKEGIVEQVEESVGKADSVPEGWEAGVQTEASIAQQKAEAAKPSKPVDLAAEAHAQNVSAPKKTIKGKAEKKAAPINA